MSEPLAVCFYYRDGCHLCEEMAARIHAGWPQLMDGMVWVDVDSNPEIRQKYGLKVPVLTRNDQVICEYQVDQAAMTVYFGAGSISV